nr:MAG TPA: hypothetical protein [Caudoviricetes sp.]
MLHRVAYIIKNSIFSTVVGIGSAVSKHEKTL